MARVIDNEMDASATYECSRVTQKSTAKFSVRHSGNHAYHRRYFEGPKKMFQFPLK